MLNNNLQERLTTVVIQDVNFNISYDNITNGILKNYTSNETKILLKNHDNLTTNWSRSLNVTENDDQTIWAPVMLLSVVLFLYNIGLGSVPYVLVSELFAINVSSLSF